MVVICKSGFQQLARFDIVCAIMGGELVLRDVFIALSACTLGPGSSPVSKGEPTAGD